MSQVYPASTQRFSDRVANYARYRPGYPAEVIAILGRKTGLDPESVVADIGSGTGISASLFLDFGCHVYAVEPNREMRLAAEQRLGIRPRFHSVAGTAEATTLPGRSVNLVVAAQAFHWFDRSRARKEFDRILKPDAHVALIWNERRLDTTPFLEDYENLLLRFGTDYRAVRHENIGGDELSRFFAGGMFETVVLPNEQWVDAAGLEGRLLSCSYVPGPGHVDHGPMLIELQRIFERHQTAGKVCFEYDTRLHLGR